MKSKLGLAFAALMSLGLARCSTITSAMGGSPQRVGDVWFVKSSYFLGVLPIGSGSVWYCPAPAPTSTQARCTEARIIEDADADPERPTSATATTEQSTEAPTPGATGTDFGTPCSDLRLGSAAVVTESAAPNVSLEAAGGQVVDGTYVLTRYEQASQSGEATRRMVIRVREGRFELSFDRNRQSEHQLSGRVRFQTNRVSWTVQCPGGATMEFDRYTATPEGLVLVSSLQRRVATFALQTAPASAPVPAPVTQAPAPVAVAPTPEPVQPAVAPPPDMTPPGPEPVSTQAPRERRHRRR